MFTQNKNLEILYEVLDMYVKEVAETLTVPPELENYQFSERFERRMQRLIRMQKKSYYRYINTVAKRAACYVLIVLTCMFVTVFSVKSLREPFVNFVVETYEKFTSLFVEKDDPTDNIELKVMLPQYIPEGYEIESVSQTKNSLMYVFTDLKGNKIIYYQYLYDYWQSILDTENVTYDKVYVNLLEGLFFKNKDMNCLIFNNDEYTFNISSYKSKEELIKIAESIEIK